MMMMMLMLVMFQFVSSFTLPSTVTHTLSSNTPTIIRPNAPKRQPKPLFMSSSSNSNNNYNYNPTDEETLYNTISSMKPLPSQLPDSLDDSALIAASSIQNFIQFASYQSLDLTQRRCRVDFDTSIGDETFTTLKSSTEFMQKMVTELCYLVLPEVKREREEELGRVAMAKMELMTLMQKKQAELDQQYAQNPISSSSNEMEQPPPPPPQEEFVEEMEETEDDIRMQELQYIVQNEGKDPTQSYNGPIIRIYFPDEGSAALARRDWTGNNPTTLANKANAAAAAPGINNASGGGKVPSCVQFSSCGGVQTSDISKDVVVLFFCPKASEAEFVEETIMAYEELYQDQIASIIFVNPLLVDMGVTGFGMAGRMLRERLIDPLVSIYYLRTLSWGALTRIWPSQFTVWQEDSNEVDGYRMIKSLDSLPSNPEVEDIYDFENGFANDPNNSRGFGLLDAIGDFVNGMTKL